MFGKKKALSARAMHYDGLRGFGEIPCMIEMSDLAFTFSKIKEKTTVTLPMERVTNVEYHLEKQYFLKYHNEEISPNKNNITRVFLVIDYKDENGAAGRLTFWECGIKTQDAFSKMQTAFNSAVGSYSL